MNKLVELETYVSDEILLIEDLEDLYPNYVLNVKKDLDLLNSALAAKDIKTIKAIAHRIKGSACSYGFPAIDLMMKIIEESALILDWNLIEKCVEDLDKYLVRIDEKIQKP